MTTTLLLLALVNLAAFPLVALWLRRSLARSALALRVEVRDGLSVLALSVGEQSATFAKQAAALLGAIRTRDVPAAEPSGAHAVDADASEDQRPTMEIGMDVWARDTGERPSVEELTTVHVPVVQAPPSQLSAASKERLARLADGIVPVYRGQPTIGRYATRPRVADAPANVRRVKGGAS